MTGPTYQRDDIPLPPPGGGIDLSAAAGQAVQIAQANAQSSADQLSKTRMQLIGPPMIPGMTPAKPMMPLPPSKISPEGAIPQGPFGSVSERKRADRQAALNSIAKIVDTARDRIHQQKVQKIQHTFETLNNAVQGYKEGQATGNQEMIKHNKKIIDEIAMDPKINKELSKAFDVDLNPMAPQKGKDKKPNPALDAVKNMHIEEWKKDQDAYQKDPQTQLSPQGQALMRGMPQTLQTNPAYQSYIDAFKAGVYPTGGEELKFQTDMADIQRKIAEKQWDLNLKDKMAANLLKTMENRTAMQQYGANWRTIFQGMSAMNRMLVLERMWTMKADKALEGTEDKIKAVQDALTKGGKVASAATLNGLKEQLKKNTDDMKAAEKIHDTKKMQELASQAEIIKLQTQIYTAQAAAQLGLDPSAFEPGAGLTPDEHDPAVDNYMRMLYGGENSGGEGANAPK